MAQVVCILFPPVEADNHAEFDREGGMIAGGRTFCHVNNVGNVIEWKVFSPAGKTSVVERTVTTMSEGIAAAY